MKILTLNLHCFEEETLDDNQQLISDFIRELDIDIIYLQEVAQSFNSSVYDGRIKTDNYGKRIMDKLVNMGLTYFYYYDYGKQAFGKVDEGLGIISKYRMLNKESFYVSRETSYDTWWTRKIIKASIRYNNTIIDLVNVHLGWTGYDEIFENQVDLLIDNLDFDNTNLIAGDFNVSENSDGYKYVLSKGLNDLYFNNNMDYFHDVTHRDYIDEKKIATRIDYVMSNEEFDTKDRKIVFKDKRVSDHFGVYIEIEFKEVDE